MANPKVGAGVGPGPHPGPPPGPFPENPVLGTSNKQPAVTGNSQTNIGVLGQSLGSAAGPATDGVFGLGQNGVHGQSNVGGGTGVLGEYMGPGMGDGVVGKGPNGIHGESSAGGGGNGVLGENSSTGTGVAGTSHQGHGIHGTNGGGSGIAPQYGAGVWGESDFGYGVYGASKTNPGVQGVSSGFEGVYGESQIAGHAGVKGVNNNGGFGVFGASNGWAGYFAGNVHADGDLRAGGNAHADGDLSAGGNLTANRGFFAGDVSVLGTLTAQVDVVVGSDCAEDFDVAPSVEAEPGTVMVLTADGALEPSQEAYDRKVAGVISGAGELKPGLILGRRNSSRLRRPLALVGRVYCKVDARYSPIEIGDLLTTSPTPGHAMKAGDASLAFGAVIGKSLGRLPSGQALIPILIALQ